MTADTTAAEALRDAQWHLRMASDALAAASRDRPLYSIDFNQAQQQLQQVAASLPRLEPR